MSFLTQNNKTSSVRIGAQRFETSPFLSCYPDGEMLNGVYAGRFYASSDGQDPAGAYWTLRRACVLYDVPERPVEITGPDAEALLEHVLSRRIGTLPEGRGRYVIACTPSGGIFMDGVVFRLDPARFWFVQPDGELETWLAAYGATFNAKVTDPQSRVLQIQGPTSPMVLRDATNGAIGESFRYFHAGFFEIGGQQVYVSRTGWTGELGFEVYTQGDTTDCPRLWRDLMTAGEPHGMIFAPLSSMGIRRIEAGILNNGSDMDWSMTPFAAGLGDFVDLNKLGFIGREALLKADRGRCLFGLKCPGATPHRDAVILHKGEVAGNVTAGAWSPYLKSGIGYVRFGEPADWSGKDVVLRLADGKLHNATVTTLPFYDSEKRIPRGLEPTLP